MILPVVSMNGVPVVPTGSMLPHPLRDGRAERLVPDDRARGAHGGHVVLIGRHDERLVAARSVRHPERLRADGARERRRGEGRARGQHRRRRVREDVVDVAPVAVSVVVVLIDGGGRRGVGRHGGVRAHSSVAAGRRHAAVGPRSDAAVGPWPHLAVGASRPVVAGTAVPAGFMPSARVLAAARVQRATEEREGQREDRGLSAFHGTAFPAEPLRPDYLNPQGGKARCRPGRSRSNHGTSVIPHGFDPTLIRAVSLRAPVSTTDTSSDGPFAT
jgi:hypothetical protein